MQNSFTSNSEAETLSIGEQLGKKLKKGDVVLLVGNLGAGKTVFTKGIAKGIGILNYHHVNSPTYTLVHVVPGTIPLFHFDLYRLETEEELLEVGFDEYLEEGGVVVIEWGNKFERIIPEPFYKVMFEPEGETKRRIEIVFHGEVN